MPDTINFRLGKDKERIINRFVVNYEAIRYTIVHSVADYFMGDFYGSVIKIASRN